MGTDHTEAVRVAAPMDDVARAEEALVEAMARAIHAHQFSDAIYGANGGRWCSCGYAVEWVGDSYNADRRRHQARAALAAAREVTVDEDCPTCGGRQWTKESMMGALRTGHAQAAQCRDCIRSHGTVSRSALAVLNEGTEQ